jgi:hypothetical protein
MICCFTICHWKAIVEDEFRKTIGEQRVIEPICDPGPEAMHLEKYTLLTELIKLGVPIQQAGRDELINDTQYERRKYSEKNVIEGDSPRLKYDLTREGILKGVLEYNVSWV